MTENETNFTDIPYPDFTQIPFVNISMIVAYFIVMALALIGNSMVCYVVLSNRKMHTVVNYYIVNLSVCDLMVGGFVLPVKLLELTAPADWGALNNSLCTAMLYLQTIFVFASVLTLVATCLERYSAIVHPLQYRKLQSKTRAKRILLVVWCIPCVVAGPFLHPAEAISNVLSSSYGTITRLNCFISLPNKFRQIYYTFLFIFIYLLPLIFIGGTCFRIAKCLLQDISFHRQGSLRRQEAYRRKVAKMVIIVVVAFTISWTPYFVVAIVTQYQQVSFLTKGNFFFTMLCINLFAFLNSCVNPFIYAAMSTKFRSGFRRIIGSFCCYLTIKSLPVQARNGKKGEYKRHVISCDAKNPSSTDSGSKTDSLQQTALPMENQWNIRNIFRSTFRRGGRSRKSSRSIKDNTGIKNCEILSKLNEKTSEQSMLNGKFMPPPRSRSTSDSMMLRKCDSSPEKVVLNIMSSLENEIELAIKRIHRSPSLPDLYVASIQDTKYPLFSN